MVIFASEDIGNAEPQALALAVAAAQTVELVGCRNAPTRWRRRRSTSRSRRSRTPPAALSAAAARRDRRARSAPPTPWLRPGAGEEYDYPA